MDGHARVGASPTQIFARALGLPSLLSASADTHLIIFSRLCRMFAFGATSTFLAVYFSALGFSDNKIGLFVTLTRAGDAALTAGTALVADGLGRRRTLSAGAGLMILSGTIFAVFRNFWVLLVAAVIGVVSSTGADFGPFRAIEEAVLAHLTEGEARNWVLAWYVTCSSMGSAIGTETGGRAAQWMGSWSGWTTTDGYQKIFWLYVAMGAMGLLCFSQMSPAAELSKASPDDEMLLRPNKSDDPEETTDPALPAPTQEPPLPEQKKPRLSSQTLHRMYPLWGLLIVDSLAEGMVGYSFTAYYLSDRFGLLPSSLGDSLSISYFLAAVSTLFSAPLANHLGLVNTMVFTHLPSSLAVLLFPLSDSSTLAVALLFLRVGLGKMDQAPRVALIAQMVDPDSRTAVLGITSVLRTLASTVGPLLTGWLAENGQFWIAFVIAGLFRVTYDLGLWILFSQYERKY